MPMSALNVELCSEVPGNDRTASSLVSVSVLPVASSMAAATWSGSASGSTSTTRTWNTSSPTAASGRDLVWISRHVSASTHRPPCSR
jgi:hypothetical protein